MARLEKVKPGQVLYTVTTHRLGNTTLRTVSVHDVKVLEVHIRNGGGSDHAVASWNGNRPEKFYRGAVARWKTKKPELVDIGFGAKRLRRRSDAAKESR